MKIFPCLSLSLALVSVSVNVHVRISRRFRLSAPPPSSCAFFLLI